MAKISACSPTALAALQMCESLMMTLIAFWVDIRSRPPKDFAFWLYLFGVLAFWGALTSMDSNSELGKFIYCCINLLMAAVGATLSRRVFAVFGGLGVALYWPLSDARFFAPWQVIRVTPLHISSLLSAKGLLVAASELLWVWLPCFLLCLGVWVRRRWNQLPPAEPLAPAKELSTVSE